MTVEGYIICRSADWSSFDRIQKYVCVYVCVCVLIEFKSVCVCVCVLSRSVSQFFATFGLWPTRLLCSWNFPGKNIEVGCHFLLHIYIYMCVYIYNGPVVNTCFASSFILSMVENTRNSQEAYNTIDERTNTQEVIQEQLGAGNKKTFKFCCCRVLALVDSVAMNTGVHVSF